jgi:hypothetical protein
MFAAFIANLVLAQGATAFKSSGIECKNEGIPTLCLEEAGKLFEAEGTEPYVGKLAAGTKAIFRVPGLGLRITCNNDASKGTIEQAAPLLTPVVSKNGELVFSSCQVVEPSGCTISEPITVTRLEGLVTDEMPIKDGVIRHETENPLVTVKLSGPECTQSGSFAISGEVLCLGVEAEVDKIIHRGECLAEGSKLTFAGKAAIFEVTAEVELAGINKGVKWDVTLG